MKTIKVIVKGKKGNYSSYAENLDNVNVTGKTLGHTLTLIVRSIKKLKNSGNPEEIPEILKDEYIIAVDNLAFY